MSKPVMATSLRREAPASPRQAGCQEVAKAPQLALAFDADTHRAELTTGVYSVMREAVAVSGGADALRARLDERESYLATISKCLNRVSDDRRAPVDWIAALLMDPDGARTLIAGLCRLAGLDAPTAKRAVSDDEAARAALAVARDLGPMRDAFRRLVAAQLGVSPEEVPL